MIEARGHALDRMRMRAFPFHSSVNSFVADHDFVFVVEQNRDAQIALADRQRMRHRSGAAGADPALRRHADHRALYRQGDRRSSRSLESDADEGECHDLSRQAEIPSPGSAEERRSAIPTATTKARSRRCAPAAAMTRSRRRSSRPASSCRSSRIAWRRSPASAARRRRRLISSAIRTVSIRCTAACRRCSPAPISPTAI